MATLEVKHQAGLHIAGELLNIDGVTGGYNFQAAWASGFVAGSAMAEGL
jgi:predicted flavoprotein YhiN